MMNVTLNLLQKELMFQVLDQVEDPQRLSLVCKKFYEYADKLFISLFKRLHLLQESNQALNDRKWLCLLKQPALKYSGADYFIRKVSEQYMGMEISFVNSITSVINWTAFRDQFDGSELTVNKIYSREQAILDAVYVNPLNYTMLQTECCKLWTPFKCLLLPIKPLSSLKEGEIALNMFQRKSLYVSMQESVKINVINIQSITNATKAVIRILKAKSVSNEQIQFSFLQKFSGHILNYNHEVLLNVEDELLTVQILQLEANKPVDFVDFAVLNKFATHLEVVRGDFLCSKMY